VSEDADLPAGPDAELAIAQLLALWAAMLPPIVRLLDRRGTLAA
jgi:hypothetical protein